MSDSDNDAQLLNKNRNQGLINTIIDHNKKMKVFKNKINCVVNNYVNSSRVKEIVVLLYLLVQIAKKFFIPWFLRIVQYKSNECADAVSRGKKRIFAYSPYSWANE